MARLCRMEMQVGIAFDPPVVTSEKKKPPSILSEVAFVVVRDILREFSVDQRTLQIR